MNQGFVVFSTNPAISGPEPRSYGIQMGLELVMGQRRGFILLWLEECFSYPVSPDWID